MGHNRLSKIPGTKSWRNVLDMLGSPVATAAVISASATAAEKDMLAASDDPVFVEAVRLLLMIPFAARADNFGQALRDAGLHVPDAPYLMDIVIAVTQRLDANAGTNRNRTDLGELSARALSNTLSSEIGDALPGLFGSTPEDVQAVVRKLSWSRGISELTRHFFGALVGETLSYWLDRTLASQTGEGLRFRNTTERSMFDVELHQYTSEATRIIKEFSGGWYGKTLHRRGEISTQDAEIFGAVSLKKIVAELRVKDARNA